MFCSKCGNELKKGTQFCIRCGIEIDQKYYEIEEVDIKTESENKSELGERMKWFLLVVLIPVIIVICFVLFGVEKSGGQTPKAAIQMFFEGTAERNAQKIVNSTLPDGFVEKGGMLTKKELIESLQYDFNALPDEITAEKLPIVQNIEVISEVVIEDIYTEDYAKDMYSAFDFVDMAGVSSWDFKVKEVREVYFSMSYIYEGENLQEVEGQVLVYKYGSKWYVDPREFY